MAIKVEMGQWIQPRGRQGVTGPYRHSLQIEVSPYARHVRPMTDHEIAKDHNFLMTIDPSHLVFIIGPLTGIRDPETLRMPQDAITEHDSIAEFLRENHLKPYSSHARQAFGQLGVSAEQASLLDGTALDRASLVICMSRASTSPNTQREVKRAIQTGKSVIMFFKDHEAPFAEKVKQQILSAPISYPPSALVPVNGETDLSPHLGRLLLEAA